MSLAAAQRNLGRQQHKDLQKAGESKMMDSLGKSMGSLATLGSEIISDKFNFKENKRAWDSIESGAEYLGLDKNSYKKPSMWQKAFKNPTDGASNMMKFTSKGKDGLDENREISMSQLKQLGTLTKSDNKEFYEKMLGDEEGGLRGAYSDKQKTNLDLQGMDVPSSAYKDQTRREESPYMGNITEENSSYEKLRQTNPSGFNEKYAPQSSILKRREAGAEEADKSTMPLPETSPKPKGIMNIDNMDYESIQTGTVQEGMKQLGSFDDTRKNYYKLMQEGTTQEQGQSYWDSIITRRNLLLGSKNKMKSSGNKPLE